MNILLIHLKPKSRTIVVFFSNSRLNEWSISVIQWYISLKKIKKSQKSKMH